MNNFVYLPPKTGHSPFTVKLEGVIVGEIRSVPGGWQYFPKGHTKGGEIFKLLSDCTKSLEED
jgi:hypothetical protein